MTELIEWLLTEPEVQGSSLDLDNEIILFLIN